MQDQERFYPNVLLDGVVINSLARGEDDGSCSDFFHYHFQSILRGRHQNVVLLLVLFLLLLPNFPTPLAKLLMDQHTLINPRCTLWKEQICWHRIKQSRKQQTSNQSAELVKMVLSSGEPRGSPGWGTPGKIEFSAPRSPGKILKNPRGKSNNKLAKIDSFYQKNVIF